MPYSGPAKGILAVRLDLDPDECFQIPRQGARNRQTSIHALAEQVVSSRSATWPP
jgi:AmiR/NasT family two-component response regulator